jgi:NTE family protein
LSTLNVVTYTKTASHVLGSSGARGLTHIGVIHWLEQHNFKIESISSGSMMAALIGDYLSSYKFLFKYKA